jgi:hypothetical protein
LEVCEISVSGRNHGWCRGSWFWSEIGFSVPLLISGKVDYRVLYWQLLVLCIIVAAKTHFSCPVPSVARMVLIHFPCRRAQS